MSRLWEQIQTFRRNRFVNLVLSAFIFFWGFWVIYDQRSALGVVLGVFFVVFGALALYNQILGESLIETIRERL